MKYDIDYEGAQELFDESFSDYTRAGIQPKTGPEVENMQTGDTNEDGLHEAERLNMLLPVMKWEIENNQLTEWIRDEIYQYYEDIQKRGFGDVIDESEREKVVHDLTECFNKVFPEGLEK